MSATPCGPALIRVNELELMYPEADYGVILDLQHEDLPRPNYRAAKAVDICVRCNGRDLEMTWEEFATKLGFEL